MGGKWVGDGGSGSSGEATGDPANLPAVDPHQAHSYSLQFFSRCPKCQNNIDLDAEVDVLHEGIIAERMSTLKGVPEQVSNERARLERLVAAREKKIHIVIEYGSVSEGGSVKGFLKVVVFEKGSQAKH